MNNIRTEQEVDELIEEMANRTKGKYITQGVAFNKTCPRQRALLKKALMASASFSGLAKEILATHFSDNHGHAVVYGQHASGMGGYSPEPMPKTKNIGNFL